MAQVRKRAAKKIPKQVTRYTHDAHDPVIPETGHTDRLVDEEVVTLEMDNGWSEALEVAKLDTHKTVVVDMDPAVDPVLLWSGKRSRRDVPVLPLQRNEIVSESRIARIIERARELAAGNEPRQGSLFAELERELRESGRAKRVEFYTHEEEWRNKLICGDSLESMESLLRYEGLAGSVQMVFVDPPYGIKYDSNFQQRIDVAKNDEGDAGLEDVLSVKAFRDTWTLGIHSYLEYLRARLYLTRELLTPSGSIFVQISEDNVHLVRVLLDEVFGYQNFMSQIAFQKTTSQTSGSLATICDYLLWYAYDKTLVKFKPLYERKNLGGDGSKEYVNLELEDGSVRRIAADELADPSKLPAGTRIYATDSIVSDGGSEAGSRDIDIDGVTLKCGPNRHWKCGVEGVIKLWKMDRLVHRAGLRIYKRYFDDFPFVPLNHVWLGLRGESEKDYVVQTSARVLERCIAMTTEPGDLVVDPTCGSGTTAVVAESLGRRWITCDTARVAIHVARRRLLSMTFDALQLLGETPAEGFEYDTYPRVTQSSLAYDREPEVVDLVDRPVRTQESIRVCGPFEVMTLGRYSLADWDGGLVDTSDVESTSGNYVEVMCRLYVSGVELLSRSGLVHGLVETEPRPYGVSIGPLTGRVSAFQLTEVVKESEELGIAEVHILGWAFEANVGEVKEQLEKEHGVRVELVMIRPDALAEGLKVTRPEMLFSPVALPEVKIDRQGMGAESEWRVCLEGVTVFDRRTRTTAYHHAQSNYIAAWYLDEDYDGDCFVDCQMFFDFKKAPNLKAAAGVDVDGDEYDLRFRSDAFAAGKYGRVAVKVVDIYGNESTVIRALGS